MANKSTCTQEDVDKGWGYIESGYLEQGEVFPTSQGLAIYLNVVRQTPYNWATQDTNPFKDEFADIVDRVQAVQAIKIISGGASGELNPAFCGRLVSNHGFDNKHTLEHSGPGGEPIKTESKIEWTIQPVKPIDETDS